MEQQQGGFAAVFDAGAGREGCPTETGSSVKAVQRIVGEYLEMPGLSLTTEQASRLWALEPGTCEQLLQHLVHRGFLRRTVRGAYVRVT